MGKILIQHNTQAYIRHLRNSSIWGRDQSLGYTRLLDIRIPNFWLEIRYSNQIWCWRVLNGENTRGTGKNLPNNWRVFSGKIRLENCLCLELIDPSPPENLVYDFCHNTVIPFSDIPDIYRCEQGCVLDTEFSMVADNTYVFVESLQRVVEIWLTPQVTTTQDSIMYFGNYIFLTCDLKNLSANFSDRSKEVVYKGEGVRVLFVYIQAKQKGNGWLSTEECFQQWVVVGGNSNSDVTRIKWERNKMCGRLFEMGIINIEMLFEKKRVGPHWFHQISLPITQMEIIE